MRVLFALAATVGFSGLSFAHDHTVLAGTTEPSIFAAAMMGAMILVGAVGGVAALRARS